MPLIIIGYTLVGLGATTAAAKFILQITGHA